MELVRLCTDEYEDLAAAFDLGDGESMLVKHLRSKSMESLVRLVEKKGGPWELVSSWLDGKNLRYLLRDDQRSPAPVDERLTGLILQKFDELMLTQKELTLTQKELTLKLDAEA